MLARHSTRWLIAAAAGISLSCLLCTGGTSAVLWWLLHSPAPLQAIDQALAPPPAALLKAAAPAAPETFQDLQDLLKAKGMPMSRGRGIYLGRVGQWFQAGDGRPIPGTELEILNDREYQRVRDRFNDVLFVEDCGTPERARQEQARILDVQQHQTAVIGRFLIQTGAAHLAELQKL